MPGNKKRNKFYTFRPKRTFGFGFQLLTIVQWTAPLEPKIFLWSLLTDTRQDQALPSHVHDLIKPQSTQFGYDNFLLVAFLGHPVVIYCYLQTKPRVTDTYAPRAACQPASGAGLADVK